MKKTVISANKRIFIVFFVLYILIFVCALTTLAIAARFTAAAEGAGGAEVADAVLSVGDSGFAVTALPQTPGSVTEYAFSVTNTNERGCSDVSLSYALRVLHSDQLPFTIALLSGETTLALTPDALHRGIGASYSFDAAQGSFAAGVARTDTYTLRVEWDSAYSGAEYADRADSVLIRIDWQQLD